MTLTNVTFQEILLRILVLVCSREFKMNNWDEKLRICKLGKLYERKEQFSGLALKQCLEIIG